MEIPGEIFGGTPVGTLGRIETKISRGITIIISGGVLKGFQLKLLEESQEEFMVESPNRNSERMTAAILDT